MTLPSVHRSSLQVQVDMTQLQKIQQGLLAIKSDSNTINILNL